MKVIQINSYGDASRLKMANAAPLLPREKEVLVRVRNAGVNPVDWKIRQGHLRQAHPDSFPLILGQDFSGEVAECGSGISRFHEGDRVFGFARGAYAEFVAASEAAIALMPDTMDFAVAAALPTAGLTALQLVRDAVDVQPGMSVLIHGAAGGVGSYACQLAKNRGAHVAGTAAGGDLDYLRSIHVDDAIDYLSERFENRVRDLDAVIDLVGGDTQTRSFAVLKRGGVLVSTVQPPDEAAAARAGVRASIMMMRRSADDLIELSRLVERGALRPRMGRVFSLDEARAAQELSQAGDAHGKIVLKVA